VRHLKEPQRFVFPIDTGNRFRGHSNRTSDGFGSLNGTRSGRPACRDRPHQTHSSHTGHGRE